MRLRDNNHIFDVAGIGFGPSNLALAVALSEQASSVSSVFFEKSPHFVWHPGMLITGAGVQISFLKDLVTLKNPSSRYSFLCYLKEKDRLENFANLQTLHPSRTELNDYFQWVAAHFTANTEYSTDVTKIELQTDTDIFEITTIDSDGATKKTRSRNIVLATGGEPVWPANCPKSDNRIIHSSKYLITLDHSFPNRKSELEFFVVGDGQSGGEIALDLLAKFENATVTLVSTGWGPRPADSSPFANEAFLSRGVDEAYNQSHSTREVALRSIASTNYSVMDADVINRLYQIEYESKVTGDSKLNNLRFTRLTSAKSGDSGVTLLLSDLRTGVARQVIADGVFLATGYTRTINSPVFSDIRPFLIADEQGRPSLTRRYRALTNRDSTAGIYLQGFGEHSHGISDTLLSLLPFRAQEIAQDIAERQVNNTAPYPPERHCEHNTAKIESLIRDHPFAVLVSRDESKGSLITELPLVISACGRFLFGHFDRSNPHASIKEGSEADAIFRGPNAYISPHIYTTPQLPTWNSMSVHIHGTIEFLSDDDVITGLQSICEIADNRPGAYRLPRDHAAIPILMGQIVGFRIRIDKAIGRFKLSQDREEIDRASAARELARQWRDSALRTFDLLKSPSESDVR